MQKARTQPLYELHGLLHEEARVRLATLDKLDLGTLNTLPACYAVREVMLADPDARVRAAATERLGHTTEHAGLVTAWLVDASEDVFPLVREASLRALGRLRPRQGEAAAAARARAGRLALLDPIWWVRRSAALALAALAQEAAIPTLRRVLGDPFWRVRHAAVQALTVLGAERPHARTQILAEGAESELGAVARIALLEVRARLERDGFDVHAFKAPEPADQPLWNTDPAVTTARLHALPESETDLRALLPLLGDPHQPLRELAVQRFFGRADDSLLREALVHVEVPGVPRACEEVWAALDELGPRAKELAAAVLRDPAPRPGELAWAANYASQAKLHEIAEPLVAHLRHPHPRARLYATLAVAELWASEPVLEEWLGPLLSDEDDEIRSAAARAICALWTRPALARVQAARAERELHPAVRLKLMHAVADMEGCCIGTMKPLPDQITRADDGVPLLVDFVSDPHPLVRSNTLVRLVNRGPFPQAEALLADPDPMIRAAVLPAIRERLAELVRTDPDPRVRRMAMQLATQRQAALAPEVRARLAEAGIASKDPQLRAAACTFCDPLDARGLSELLKLSRDPEPAVRAAASGQLVTRGSESLGTRIRELLTAMPAVLSDEQRAAAYTFLCRNMDEAAACIAEAALADPQEPPVVREQLAAQAPLFDDEILDRHPQLAATVIAQQEEPAPSQIHRRRRPRVRADGAARRPLGRTGIAVSPLGISGAQHLPESSLYRAVASGVNLFFWEPSYLELGRFLRRAAQSTVQRADLSEEDEASIGPRRDLVIVAGTYEGDRAGIERDVRRALKRLRTSYLDVFLLFWVRSPERLSAEALETLRDLKRRGLIRSFGFSSHDRPLLARAVQSGDWDVVMLRHSAAHPGAEDEILPLALRHDIGVLSFSSLSYGRLLDALPGAGQPEYELPTAAECYRYSMQQPGVSATWSAPRHGRELRENLTALTQGPLPPERLEVLRRHGAALHADSRRFGALLRKGHTDADAAQSPPQRLGALLAQLMESMPPPDPAADAGGSAKPRTTATNMAPPRRGPRRAGKGATSRATS